MGSKARVALPALRERSKTATGPEKSALDYAIKRIQGK